MLTFIKDFGSDTFKTFVSLKVKKNSFKLQFSNSKELAVLVHLNILQISISKHHFRFFIMN